MFCIAKIDHGGAGKREGAGKDIYGSNTGIHEVFKKHIMGP
jgi:hypothetical protein